MLEQYEKNDWKVDNSMSNNERRLKSISAYYLNEWYNKVKDITFDTYIYPISDTLEKACPDVLPFDKCMVRYENKSPKDSEYWGPITNKLQLLKVFNTSLRCITTQNIKPVYKYLCIRKWEDKLSHEYRCFWNTKLVAVSTQSNNNIFDDNKCYQIMDYIKSIEKYIPYQRCVFDIACVDDTFKLVEFNSWETNSGADLFSWTTDTEILYPDLTLPFYNVTFRCQHNQKQYEITNNDIIIINSDIDITKLKILRPNKPSNWLITDKYIYITTDIWLGRFTHELKNINWKRGIYRFTNVELCENGDIYVNEEYLHYDLSKSNSKTNIKECNGDIYNEYPYYKYGFYCIYDNILHFCSLMNNGKFYLSGLE
jgi:hypothetical protein